MRRAIPSVVAGLLGALVSGPAFGTYSICAVDQARQQVGGAGTSCVGNLDVAVIYGAVAGVGVVHAQARLFERGRDRAVQRLQEGQSPAQIISELSQRNFDRDFGTRQYGVVTLSGDFEGFTGDGTGAWAGHRGGQVDSYVYAAQGNLLTGAPVVDRTALAFEAGGCDLADRLMLALEAGRQAGEGDARCTPRGVPSDSAFIRVDRSDGQRALGLSVTGTGNQDPVTLLRAQYDQWRMSNPCPAPPDAGLPEDAAVPEDAGLPVDTGLPEDAAQDAGLDAAPVDAALPDAGRPDTALPDDARVGADAAPTAPDAGARVRITGGCTCSGRRPGRGLAGLIFFGILSAFPSRRRAGGRAGSRARGSVQPVDPRPAVDRRNLLPPPLRGLRPMGRVGCAAHNPVAPLSIHRHWGPSREYGGQLQRSDHRARWAR